ncbi:hypothetical protein [Hyphobacterium sp. CCMP332]|uniref:hypothetical protein n=1 Tax=Hyphobacterium sp. CCMP332 TaxID=2749086 RepID=UPI001F18BBAB|nr:hypothetical protein [Hyphobacterium sp. CCMP332]
MNLTSLLPSMPVILAIAVSLSACASNSVTGTGVDETRSAVSDAVGLPRDRPGEIMVDEGDETVPTPYGGEGAPRVRQRPGTLPA